MKKRLKRFFNLNNDTNDNYVKDAYLMSNVKMIYICATLLYLVELVFVLNILIRDHDEYFYNGLISCSVAGALGLIIFIFSKFKFRDISKYNVILSRVLSNLLCFIIAFACIFYSACCTKSSVNSVLVIAAIVVLPNIFYLFPVDIIILQVICCTAFVIFSYNFKNSDIFNTDIIYGLIAIACGDTLAYAKQVLKMENTLSEYRFEELNKKLYVDARLDLLTGILNKKSLEYSFNDLSREQINSYCFLLIDLDDFKLINDLFGHSEGDRILLEFAKKLKLAFPDDLVGRVGGDEFAIIINDIDEQTIENTLRGILDGIRNELLLPNGKNVTLSAGAFISKNMYLGYQSLYFNADKALYEAKRAGKARLVVKTKTSGKMLVVDDDMLNREILKNFFKDEYEVLETSNGREALDVIEQLKYDISVVLLDIEMPEVDGFEVLKKLREDPILKDMIVVVITCHANEELKALQNGANELITKPFDPRVVRERIYKLLK